MTYMLDTNICIFIIKQKPATVLQRFSSLVPEEICISSVTLAELMTGAEKSSDPKRNAAAVAQFVSSLQILSFDYDAAMTYAVIRAALEKAGTPIGALDTLIAAHAVSRQLILVTNNTREFTRIASLSSEDWF